MKLRERLDSILMEYIKRFEKKHGLEFEFAVNDDLMGTISFGCVYCFHISDIIYDIDNKLKKGLIMDWLNDHLDCNTLKDPKDYKYINLHAYAKGVRYEDLTKELA